MKHIQTVKKLIGGIGVFTALSLVASFFNFLFNFILIRLLTPQEFRDLTLANNLINIFGNLFVALNIVSIAIFYVAKDSQANIIRACQKLIYGLYVVLLGLCVVFSSTVQQRTGLHDTILLNVTLAVIFFSIPVMVLNAIYLGGNRFNRSAIMNVSLALGRLLVGIVGAAMLATHKDIAAIAGILVVFVIVFNLFSWLEKPEIRHKNLEFFKHIWEAPVHILKQHRSLIIASVLYALTINFLLGMDLFMFGQFFSAGQSADYAAVSVIGKLSFFFIAPISLYLAAKQQEFIASRPLVALKTSVGVNTLILLVGIILTFLPPALVSLLIHRAPNEINTSYLTWSVIFNGAVVMANHQIIEAIVGKRHRLAAVVCSGLLIIGGTVFLFFKDIVGHFPAFKAVDLALGLPALAMILAALILFSGTHLFRLRRR
ncbi:MAG TPA: hypothetical protein VF733_01780 [Candidatus Saccharimonadales bacterium]